MLLRITTKLAGEAGVEPATEWLTATSSTAELLSNKLNNKLAGCIHNPSCHDNTRNDNKVAYT
jgi:hypothetical protein